MLLTEIIISTYNNASALDLVLIGLKHQLHREFSLCIADDGSSPDTSVLIKRWQQSNVFPQMRHVWHRDEGFRKNAILNKAIASSNADFIIFIDGDCVPHSSFVARHVELREANRFCSGGVIRLNRASSLAVNESLIASGEVFTHGWLLAYGEKRNLSTKLKSADFPLAISNFLEITTPVKRTFNGGNCSVWRSDLIKVNGFENSLRYGAEDIELGYRLNNIGVRGRHLRYTAPLLHLDHDRPYADQELIRLNRLICNEVRLNKIKWAKNGISQLENLGDHLDIESYPHQI